MSAIDPEKLEEAIGLAQYAQLGVMQVTLRKETFGRLLEAARAHLSTLPRVKEVEVWHVEYVYPPYKFVTIREDRANADVLVGTYERDGALCVRVTGPHKHQVPS